MSRTAPGPRRERARRGEGDRLRAEILEATQTLLESGGGAHAVSIRAIAQAVGCTPPSIYLHFTDKAQLLLEVCRSNFERMAAETSRAVDGIEDPAEALKAVGRAYVRFGAEHPEQYRVLFMERPPEDIVPMVLTQLDDVTGFAQLLSTSRRCVAAGLFASDDPVAVACVLWAVVHGLTSLLITKPSFPWTERDEAVDRCLDAVCRGLRTPVA
jgi:AcrR family transcriptional regulator